MTICVTVLKYVGNMLWFKFIPALAKFYNVSDYILHVHGGGQRDVCKHSESELAN